MSGLCFSGYIAADYQDTFPGVYYHSNKRTLFFPFTAVYLRRIYFFSVDSSSFSFFSADWLIDKIISLTKRL
jgi:hypothetical protein